MPHTLPGGVVRLYFSKVASERLYIAVQGCYPDRQRTGSQTVLEHRYRKSQALL